MAEILRLLTNLLGYQFVSAKFLLDSIAQINNRFWIEEITFWKCFHLSHVNLSSLENFSRNILNTKLKSINTALHCRGIVQLEVIIDWL